MTTEIGKYLKELRGTRSLREVSKLTNISHTYLSDLEKGKDRRTGNTLMPSPTTLEKISRGLGVDYLDLFEKAGYVRDKESFIKATKKISSRAEESTRKELEAFEPININELLDTVTNPIKKRIDSLNIGETNTNIFLNDKHLTRDQAMNLGKKFDEIEELKPKDLDMED